jgi:hypothetical protein
MEPVRDRAAANVVLPRADQPPRRPAACTRQTTCQLKARKEATVEDTVGKKEARGAEQLVASLPVEDGGDAVGRGLGEQRVFDEVASTAPRNAPAIQIVERQRERPDRLDLHMDRGKIQGVYRRVDALGLVDSMTREDRGVRPQ